MAPCLRLFGSPDNNAALPPKPVAYFLQHIGAVDTFRNRKDFIEGEKCSQALFELQFTSKKITTRGQAKAKKSLPC